METNPQLQPPPTFLLRQIAAHPALTAAWRKVRANRGAAGIDAVGIREFERNLDANLGELSRNLLNRTYEPLPSRYVHIPKANGKQRELAIPTVRDRVAQRAVLDALEPHFEPQFLDCSYAFRPGRSVEMAVQQIVVARAQGLRWTVDADIQDFFPSIDHQILLSEVSGTVDDADVLRLLNLWLEAGALDGTRPTRDWLARWQVSLAGVQLAARDAVNHLLNEYVADHLGNTGEAWSSAEFESDAEMVDEQPKKASGLGRALTRRLVQDGLLLAVAHRGALRGLLTAKTLTLGGAALALAAAAPPVIRKLREMAATPTGALQGAPISPLLSNIILHRFDVALTQRGFRLVRYCDDFVILCRSQAEARDAKQWAESLLRERKLRLSVEKTHLRSAEEPFDFLGYHFAADGRVIAPPNVPEVVGQRVMAFAERTLRKAGTQLSATRQKTQTVTTSLRERLAERLKPKS
jgi:RNA-directed DNA polymerase